MALETLTRGIGAPPRGLRIPTAGIWPPCVFPREPPPSRGLRFPPRRVGALHGPSRRITLPSWENDARRARRPQARPLPGRAYLIAALLLAHLTVPAQLLQPLGLDAVGDGLGAEEIRLPHGAGADPPPPLSRSRSLTPTGSGRPHPGSTSRPPSRRARLRACAVRARWPSAGLWWRRRHVHPGGCRRALPAAMVIGGSAGWERSCGDGGMRPGGGGKRRGGPAGWLGPAPGGWEGDGPLSRAEPPGVAGPPPGPAPEVLRAPVWLEERWPWGWGEAASRGHGGDPPGTEAPSCQARLGGWGRGGDGSS